ncbi:MAG: MurR/RpiR family transcriptional regulator [Hungatella sp.]|jgi:DNA-binding MurR/RpiR family transcriptional regulator|nr:MurR/RpiR family transcriptional regulator [Hungatella sp.]
MLVREKLQDRQYFSDIDCRIADYILDMQEKLRDMSVRRMAKELYVAPSTIIRFCQKAGYEGFNDLREDYLKEVEYLSSHFKSLDPNFPFDRRDKEMTVANKIEVLYEEILRDCKSLLEGETLKKAVDMIEEASELYICTQGAQMGLAEIFQEKMARVGKMVHMCTHMGEGYYQACYCREKAVFIMISYTGETRTGLKIGRKARERGLSAVAVTSYGNNSLSELCDVCLYVSTREKLINNLGSFGFNVSVMYLLDVLYAGYFNRDYEKHYREKVKVTKEYENRHSDNPILEG